ncbi:MAG: flagellin [Pseudomonadota bacterium]
MTSLLTNTAAMVALQTLNDINANLNDTNNAVSTGLRIADASDSAAYWAIATTTMSDNGALGTVGDAIAIGRSTLDVMYSGLESVRDNLQQMKELLVAARQPGVDRDNIQTEIDGLVADMVNKAGASVINEQNFLAIADHDTENMTKSVVASFERSAGGVSISTIDLDIDGLFLTDGEATIADREGILDQARAGITATTNNGGILALATDGADTAISDITDSAADLTTLEGYITAVDTALTEVITAQNVVGVNLARAESQESFLAALMDANERAVGALIDANMEEESTMLRALQTQQQLAVQSLSIANAASQNVLTLFR